MQALMKRRNILCAPVCPLSFCHKQADNLMNSQIKCALESCEALSCVNEWYKNDRRMTQWRPFNAMLVTNAGLRAAGYSLFFFQQLDAMTTVATNPWEWFDFLNLSPLELCVRSPPERWMIAAAEAILSIAGRCENRRYMRIATLPQAPESLQNAKNTQVWDKLHLKTLSLHACLSCRCFYEKKRVLTLPPASRGEDTYASWTDTETLCTRDEESVWSPAVFHDC